MNRSNRLIKHSKPAPLRLALLAVLLLMLNLFGRAEIAAAQSDADAMSPRLFMPSVASRGQAVLDEQAALQQLLAGAASSITIIDDGGSNDPNGDGQNDLTRLTGDDPSTTALFEVAWSWDEPTTIKGGNASNACAMFDTDGDGNVNYSFCVEVSYTAALGYFITNSGSGTDSVKDFPAWIACSDAKDDRCTQPTRLADPYTIPPVAATCSIAEANTDPFGPTAQTAGTPGGAGDDYPADLTATCQLQTSLIPTGGKFINVCSYPSAGNDGNNNPFDCVVTPGSGFLTIVKNANPSNATAFTFSASDASTNGESSWTINGSGSVQLIPYAPTTTLDLNEAVPSGWKLDSASCVIQPSTATGTPDAPPAQIGPISKGVQNLTIKSGLETICTFNDSLAEGPPSILVTKTANPTTINEPGGSVSFSVSIKNTSDATDPVTITSLTDSIHGDLNSQGTCSVPQTIQPGSTYSCSFSATVSGNAGYTETDIVTASGTDNEGTPVSGSDDATVTVTDVPATINVIKSASPTTVDEPGGDVTFSFEVKNTSAVDAVTINSLTDSIYGDLNGKGDCTVPQTIAVGCSYSCSFTIFVSGNAGDSHTNVATASGMDDDNQAVSDDDMTLVSSGVLQLGVTLVKTGGDQDNLLETGETWTYTWTAVVPVSATNATNTNTATVTARDDEGTSATDDDTASVRFIDYGQIAPTGTTCQQYVTGTAVDFSVFYASQGGVVQYQAKSNKISATNPGVFFYWTGMSKTITGSGPVFIDQSDNNTNIGPFSPVKNDIKLWLVNGTTCTQVQLQDSQITISNGDVTVNVANPAPAGSYYVISVKYDTGSVIGQNATGKPTVKFTFTTDVGNNGSVDETDTKGITLAPK